LISLCWDEACGEGCLAAFLVVVVGGANFVSVLREIREACVVLLPPAGRPGPAGRITAVLWCPAVVLALTGVFFFRAVPPGSGSVGAIFVVFSRTRGHARLRERAENCKK
jgi:hypothetical protein